MSGYRASLKTLPSHSSSESAEVPAEAALATAPELSFVNTPKRMAQVRAADPPKESQRSGKAYYREPKTQPLHSGPRRRPDANLLRGGCQGHGSAVQSFTVP